MATILEIQTCIDNLTTSTADELLLLAAETNALTTDRIVKVATCANLPDLVTCNLSNGTVVFVENINVPVMSANGCWVGLDNRVLRQDYAAADAYVWGGNACGRLGTGNLTNSLIPVSVVGGFTDWRQVNAGACHSIGVRCDGTAWAWGRGGSGQLGDGTTVNKSSPVGVAGGFTDWCQVSAGNQHSLGVRTNGTAWGWGIGGGALGDGTIVAKSSPVSVVGGFTDWCQVSAGTSFNHSLGVRTNGTAWAWGSNYSGTLGDGTTVDRSSPVSVVGGFTNWCQVSAGDGHSLGVRTNGTAWAWGCNGFGRLGTGNVYDRSSPVSIVGGFTDWCQVDAGCAHSLGVRTNGTAWGWGVGCRTGDGTGTARSSPVSVVGGFTDWCQVSAGNAHSLGLRTNGTAWAWGGNLYGVLGDGSLTTRSSPVSVAGGFTDWCQVSAGGHSMAVKKY